MTVNRPNILILMTDQQQASTIDPCSPCLTPHLDALAGEGMLFSRAYTCNAICSPTRASLMTGVLPHLHGQHDCTHVVSELHAKYDPGLPTWAQRLEEAGYQTSYFGKWHVERTEKLDDYGWQRYNLAGKSYGEYRRSLGLPAHEHLISSKSLGGRGYRDTVLYGVTDEPESASRPYYIFSQAIEHLGRLEPGRPWCMFVSTPEPHDEYIAHTAYRDLYDAATLVPPASWNDNLADKPDVLKRMQGVFAGMSWEEVAEATACYYATCSLIDAQVGRIVAALRQRGELENTVIIYTADHGDMMGAHGLFTKGITPYEEVYRVPLLIRAPGNAQAGTVCERVVESCGLASTILDLASCERLPNQHFRSHTPLLRDANDPAWEDFCFSEFYGQRFAFTQYLLWEKRFKLVLNAFAYDELYDLKSDPAELHNLALLPRYQPIKERLLKRMWRAIEETGDTCMFNSHYWSLRFFDLGPNCNQES
ncbi:MAG: sulfatase-like hydrolase/transferase [Chloroflexi bacterium]|nr:sulfatase-like hydrolase/transferase [Chloroflexota bacterium]